MLIGELSSYFLELKLVVLYYGWASSGSLSGGFGKKSPVGLEFLLLSWR